MRDAHENVSLPLLRLPAKTDDLDEIAKAAARLRAGATDVVVLGTGGSSLGGQTLAQLAGVGVRGIEAFRAGPRLHFMDNLDPATYGGAARQAAARDHALHRDLEIRRHRRDADADRRGARRPSRRPGSRRASANCSSASARAVKPGKRNGLRDLLGSSVEVLEHDPGVGGRYSALTNVGLLPAAVLGLDIEAIRAGAAMALAPVLARRPAGRGAGRARRRAQCRGRRARARTSPC